MLRVGAYTFVWFIIILTTIYSAYNPAGVSVFHLWVGQGDMVLPLRLLLTAVIVVLIGLYVWGSWRAIGAIGFTILGVLIGLSLWLLSSLGMFDPTKAGVWAWTAQPLLALVLTLGFRWPKIWRSATGTFSVEDPDTGDGRP